MSKNIVNSNCSYGSGNEAGIRITALLPKIMHARGKRSKVEQEMWDQIWGALKT